MPKLRLHSPASIPGLGSMFVIPGEVVTVGRGPDNQLVIPESSVSWRHARLQRKAEGWVLTDLGDTNGIWVGVKRVTELALQAGQLFRIGGVALEFVPDEYDEPRPKVAAHDTLVAPFESISQGDGSENGGALAAPPSSPKARIRVGIQHLVVGLLTLSVLGLAVAFGGYFALRWMSKSRQGSRSPAASAKSDTLPRPALRAVDAVPEVLLADIDATNIAAEQRADVSNLLSLVLPPNALHTPTHLVVARTSQQGSPFCNATDFAGPVIEISTSLNRVWAHPGTIELSVDAAQLDKTRVSAVAIGLMDQTRQAWQLLPTEFDTARRTARAQFRQPGYLALFFVKGPEYVVTSEHFALLTEPQLNPGNSAKPERDRAALAQLEAALSRYRDSGYRVPSGTLWVCASQRTIPRSMALLPVVHRSELSRAHSHALARAAFAALIPAYMNSHSVDGRQFWVDAMLNAVASQTVGSRVTGNSVTFKRLSSSLLTDDWPSAPLYLSVIARTLDQHIDLFRIWTDTTHVVNDLDAKTSAEGQSPVLPIELALQQETQKSLLDLYADFVKERLLAAPKNGPEASPSERCPSPTPVPAGVKNGTVQLDVPGHYTARWLCLSLDVPAGKYRSVQLQLAAAPPPGLNIRLLRLGGGQPTELPMSATQSTRIDIASSDSLMIVGVNSNMAQNTVVTLRYNDVTIGAGIEPNGTTLVRPGQNVTSNLQLSGIFPEMKNLDVEWDYGDETPKDRATLAVPAGAAMHLEKAHAWAKPGTFTLRATAFDSDHPTQAICFASRQVTVQPVRLELSAIDSNPEASSEVHFLIKATGPIPDAPQYRMNFGDGSDPLVVTALETSHRYAKTGQYSVVVELVVSPAASEVMASSKTVLTVRAAPMSAPEPVPSADPAAVPVPSSSASVQ
jgi:hypothetical protein